MRSRSASITRRIGQTMIEANDRSPIWRGLPPTIMEVDKYVVHVLNLYVVVCLCFVVCSSTVPGRRHITPYPYLLIEESHLPTGHFSHDAWSTNTIWCRSLSEQAESRHTFVTQPHHKGSLSWYLPASTTHSQKHIKNSLSCTTSQATSYTHFAQAQL